jgi:signal transduction histidine kinase
VTCPDAFAALFAEVMGRHPLLPAAVTGGIENSRLVSVQVSTPSGRSLFRAGPTTGAGYAGDPASAGGWIVVRASLPSEIAARLVLTTSGSRVPLLLGLLALTAALAVIALRQLRREQELARLRSDFTSSVSHELRTPLTQILLFTETLELGRAGNEEEQRQALGIIGQEARRLAVLVENVLQFSRAERHLTGVRMELTPLASLMREILERFAPLAGLAAMRIHTDLDESLVAPVDPDALHQITINLLDNAIKYGNREGQVTLRTRLLDGHARIEVEDGGPGIAPADRLRIWDPFVRIAEASSVPGSGIGLAVVRELVSCHGGRAWVEDAPTCGARFVVELPGASQIETTSEPPIRLRATEV